MRALDARDVHETRAASDQRAAWERQLRDGLPAALDDGARAIADALAALQNRRDEGVRLEALEFMERACVGVPIVQVHDETQRETRFSP